jgi:hypothetical protein
VYSSNVYYFIPRQIVVIYNTHSTRRYQLVYAKTLKLNKGVDNKIQFQYLNQEQKPVDVTNFEVTFRLLNYNGTETLLQKTVTKILPLTGICELLVTSNELVDVDPQMCYYSLEISENGYNFPTFVDSAAGARGSIEVVNSVLPDFLPATNITIPSHVGPNVNSSEVTYYSSIISTTENSSLTIQTKLDGYTGNVQVQGSTVPESDWYNLGNVAVFTDSSESTGFIIEGFHPFVRLEFVSTQGNISHILAR